ncbi:hypothetical protein BDN72DRAFT_781476, partial [Pluteus cervinus]
VETLRLAGVGKELSLRTLGSNYYHLVLQYLRQRWQNDLDLRADVEMLDSPRQVSFDGDVFSHSHFFFQERRYGASTTTRGQSAQYAYIDNRIPVRISYVFRVLQPHYSDRFAELKANFAIVQRFCPLRAAFSFPWDLRAVDLGIHVWEAEELMAPEVVALERFSGQFVLAPISSHGHNIWITIAHDHVRIIYLLLEAMFTMWHERIDRNGMIARMHRNGQGSKKI